MSKKEEATIENEAHGPVYELANRISRSTIAVIDTMVQRGAIKGEELSTLGQLRDQCSQMVTMCETYQQDQAAES
jgi:hypothetical protein